MNALHDFDRDGFAILPGFLTAKQCDDLIREVEIAQQQLAEPHAMRDILNRIPAARALAANAECRAIVEILIGPSRCVRGILFDKVPGANWKVAWHQDRTIALAERGDEKGFGPWSMKAGIPHADAPAELLERMVTLRIHLDQCGPENGPLRVIAGSHLSGKLNDAQITARRAEQTETTCCIDRGGLLVMRPLLLHASSPASLPDHRRVIHLEYGPVNPGGTLAWHDSI